MFSAIYRMRVLAVFLASISITASSALAQSTNVEAGPVSIVSIQDVIESWSPDLQLFVKGDIGVGRRQLVELQRWLHASGPHWTIVLLENANGEAFDARDGRRYAGLDAVEHALGYGLSNRTGFGSLEHPKTKEKDGAIFVLFLQERKFSYFSSDAQDRRGLGQSHWIGELDQPAFRAMRAGGRIIDAVKDTVQTIDGRLNQAIQAEADAARRIEREQQRAIEFLKAGLIAAEASIDEVEKNAAAFRAEHAEAKGPLTEPPVTVWREALARLSDHLTPASTRSNEQSLAKIADEIARYLNAFSVARAFAQQSTRLESRMQGLRQAPNAVANPLIESSQKIIETAKNRMQDGQMDIAEWMARAEQSLAQADMLVAQENERLDRLRLRDRWIRRTVVAMLAILGFGLAVLLWILNRKRRPAMLQAKQEFREREQSVRRETDHLDKLFQRNGEILGSREKIVERGYTGLTRKLSEQALDYVDDLFIMSKEVNRVMEEARALIYPRNPIGRLVNWFSSFRYQQGMNHLSGKPLRFTKSSGLPWILRDSFADRKEGALPAEVPEEIALKFEDIFQAFQKRGVEAQSSLSTIENSLTSVHDLLGELHTKLEMLTEREQRLANAAQQDGYFGMPKFVEVLLPSIQADLARADELSTFDAVQAVDVPIPTASRKLVEAEQLSNLLEGARRELFPKLKAAAEELKTIGYTSHWIDTALDEITRRSDLSLERAAQHSIAEELGEIAEALAGLEDNAWRCVELSKEIQDEHRPSLQSLDERIADARKDMAVALRLPGDALLHELDRDPDDCLSRGRDSIEAAKAMLVQGRAQAATSAIDTMKSEAARADFILGESKAAIEAYSKVRLTNTQSLNELRTRSDQLLRQIAAAKKAYASSALFVRYSEAQSTLGSIPSREKIAAGIAGLKDSTKAAEAVDELAGTKTADHLVEEAMASTAEVQQFLEWSEVEHHQGQVLKAADRLRDADRILRRSHALLRAVSEHLDRLEGQSRENANRQVRCEQVQLEIERDGQDRLVTAKTLQAIDQIAAKVRSNRQSLETSPPAPNPFESAQVIESVAKRLEELQSQIIADRQGHAEAARAVAGAERQLEVAKQFVQRSQSDGIVDSQLIVQLNQRIAQYSQQLATVRQDLRVPHGDWKSVDDQASQLQSDISQASEKLSDELQVASQALQAFQQASQDVFRAEQWSGAWGMRVTGAPGVNDLEGARLGLQSGDYRAVLDLSRMAAAAAQAAIMLAEREIARRRMEEQRAAEMARRAREAARQAQRASRDFGGGFGDLFGGGGGGYSGGRSSSSSSSSSSSRSSSSSSSSGGTSGFSRSGW